jgi:hypothetical protein
MPQDRGRCPKRKRYAEMMTVRLSVPRYCRIGETSRPVQVKEITMPREPCKVTKCTCLLCSKRTERSPNEKRCVQPKALEGVKSKPEHATLSTACCPSLPLRFGPTLLAAKQATRLKATPRRTQRRNDRANTWQLLAAEPVACRTAAAAGAWSKERRRNGCHPLAATSRIELVGCLARWGLDKIKEGRRARLEQSVRRSNSLPSDALVVVPHKAERLRRASWRKLYRAGRRAAATLFTREKAR